MRMTQAKGLKMHEPRGGIWIISEDEFPDVWPKRVGGRPLNPKLLVLSREWKNMLHRDEGLG